MGIWNRLFIVLLWTFILIVIAIIIILLIILIIILIVIIIIVIICRRSSRVWKLVFQKIRNNKFIFLCRLLSWLSLDILLYRLLNFRLVSLWYFNLCWLSIFVFFIIIKSHCDSRCSLFISARDGWFT